MCTVHYNCAPVTSATLHIWNQNSLVVQIMFISSHEIEHLFSNKAQRLVYQQPHHCTSQWLAPQFKGCSRFFSGTLLSSHTPSFLHSSHQLSKIANHFSATSIFVTTARICTMMMSFDHDKFYGRLSNCQPHHTVQILVVSRMVLTTTTMHNMALGTSTKSQRTHQSICPLFTYVTIDLLTVLIVSYIGRQ